MTSVLRWYDILRFGKMYHLRWRWDCYSRRKWGHPERKFFIGSPLFWIVLAPKLFLVLLYFGFFLRRNFFWFSSILDLESNFNFLTEILFFWHQILIFWVNFYFFVMKFKFWILPRGRNFEFWSGDGILDFDLGTKFWIFVRNGILDSWFWPRDKISVTKKSKIH